MTLKPASAFASLFSGRKAIVFDLDGTLLDTVDDIRGAISDALVDCGYAPLPSGYTLPNLHGVFPESLLAVMAKEGIADSAREPLTARYRHHYTARAHRSSRPFPGVVDFLRDCRARGLRMGVCTNKRHKAALQALSRCGIDGFFEHVSGSDTVERPKPDPLPLLQAFDALGAAPQEALYVGDSHVDAESASRAGVPFLLFTAGYGIAVELSRHPAAASFGSYAELSAALAAALAGGEG